MEQEIRDIRFSSFVAAAISVGLLAITLPLATMLGWELIIHPEARWPVWAMAGLHTLLSLVLLVNIFWTRRTVRREIAVIRQRHEDGQK